MDSLTEPERLEGGVGPIRDIHDVERCLIVLVARLETIEEGVKRNHAEIKRNHAEIKAIGEEMRRKHDNIVGKAVTGLGALIFAVAGALWHFITNGGSTPR